MALVRNDFTRWIVRESTQLFYDSYTAVPEVWSGLFEERDVATPYIHTNSIIGLGDLEERKESEPTPYDQPTLGWEVYGRVRTFAKGISFSMELYTDTQAQGLFFDLVRQMADNYPRTRDRFFARFFNEGAKLAGHEVFDATLPGILPDPTGKFIYDGKPFFAADIVSTLGGIDGDRVLVTTPYHLRNLLESGVEVPPLRLALSATAPLDPALAREAESRLGAPLLEIYGCTEAGQLATRRTVSGPTWQVFDGVRIDEQPDGWYASGGHVTEPTRLADRLELDDARHFRLLGRDNDLVNIAGKRTSIAHLNHLIQSIPGVRDGAFVDPDAPDAAMPAASNPRRLTAFFVSDTLDANAVRAALRRMTDPAFVPRPLYRVASLPRAETGKLPRHALLALAERCRKR